MRPYINPTFECRQPGEIAEILIKDINSLSKDSRNIVISGVANNNIWGKAANYIREAHYGKNCRFEFILGPIVSAGRDGKSGIIELAKEGCVELYVSYCAQRMHRRLFNLGKRHGINEKTFLWYEVSHEEPVPEKRRARRFTPEGPMGYEVMEAMERFNFLISSGDSNGPYYPKSKDPEKDFLV